MNNKSPFKKSLLEPLIEMFLFLFISGSILSILIMSDRDYQSEALFVALIIVAILSFSFICYPIEQVKSKIKKIDCIISMVTKFSISISLIMTLYSLTFLKNIPTSILDFIKTNERLYFFTLYIITLSSIYSIIRPIILKIIKIIKKHKGTN